MEKSSNKHLKLSKRESTYEEETNRNNLQSGRVVNLNQIEVGGNNSSNNHHNGNQGHGSNFIFSSFEISLEKMGGKISKKIYNFRK